MNASKKLIRFKITKGLDKDFVVAVDKVNKKTCLPLNGEFSTFSKEVNHGICPTKD